MQKHLIGFSIFLFVFFVGYVVSIPRFSFRRSATESSPSNESVQPVATPSPEFPELAVDEDTSDRELVFASVDKGKSAVCRSERPSFLNGSALVLFRRGERFALERTKVTLGPLEKYETSSVYPVDFKDSRNAFFFLSDNDSLKPGPVLTLYAEPWSSNVPDDELFFDGLRIGDSRTFQIGERISKVRVSTGPTSGKEAVAVLVLENAEQKQMIWYGSILNNDDEVGELKWVGDIDGDERLDLLFMFYERNGGGSVEVLLLSTYAKPGNLVGPAAFSFARDCR